VQYADDLVLLVMEVTVLQSMINALTEPGKCFRTEMNVENLNTSIPSTHYDRSKTTGEM